MQTRTHLIAAAATLALLAGCGQQESAREIDWAKAALARNPAFEIVATDETAGVFTVRDTVTGTVRTIRLEELIATPLPARAIPAVAQPAPPAPAEPVEAPAAETEPALLANDQTTETVIGERAGSGTPLAEGPGYRITRGAAADSSAQP